MGCGSPVSRCVAGAPRGGRAAGGPARGGAAAAPAPAYVLHDSHLHLTNYIQEGTDIHDFLKIMGDKVGRVALFGLPLQQMWDKNNTGDFAPTYYLQTRRAALLLLVHRRLHRDAYKSLTPAEQARFDPMITGFNPADMYAADHIKRVLLTFPGVFSGIGEFTIHKEFVSSKIAGKTASLLESGARPHPRLRAARPAWSPSSTTTSTCRSRSRARSPTWSCSCATCCKRHPKTNIIWAHAGVGRIVHPVKDQLGIHGARPGEPGAARTSTSTSPGTRWRSTSWRRPRRPRRWPT